MYHRPQLTVVEGSTDPLHDFDADLIREFCFQVDVSAITKLKYRTQLEEFRSWLSHPRTRRIGGPVGLCGVEQADVVRFMSYLVGGERYAAPSHACRKGTLAPSTRKSFLASLRALYRYLVSVKAAATDPTDGVKRPKVKLKPGMRLTGDEVRQLLAVRGTPRDRIQVYLLAFTAARVGELRSLRWRDVDFVEGTLMLHGKGDQYRMIDIHPRLLPELRRWLVIQDQYVERSAGMQQARLNPDTDFVLMSRNGRKLAANAIAKQLKRRATRAGLYVLEEKHGEYRSQVSPHALRRTFATLLLNDGHHIDAVADVLGHRSVDTTRNHYAFSSNARRRKTIEGFDV